MASCLHLKVATVYIYILFSIPTEFPARDPTNTRSCHRLLLPPQPVAACFSSLTSKDPDLGQALRPSRVHPESCSLPSGPRSTAIKKRIPTLNPKPYPFKTTRPHGRGWCLSTSAAAKTLSQVISRCAWPHGVTGVTGRSSVTGVGGWFSVHVRASGLCSIPQSRTWRDLEDLVSQKDRD